MISLFIEQNEGGGNNLMLSLMNISHFFFLFAIDLSLLPYCVFYKIRQKNFWSFYRTPWQRKLPYVVLTIPPPLRCTYITKTDHYLHGSILSFIFCGSCVMRHEDLDILCLSDVALVELRLSLPLLRHGDGEGGLLSRYLLAEEQGSKNRRY